jgi:hypothetical protein
MGPTKHATGRRAQGLEGHQETKSKDQGYQKQLQKASNKTQT